MRVVQVEGFSAHAKTIQRYQKGKHVMAEPGFLDLRSDLGFGAGSREKILSGWGDGLRQLKVGGLAITPDGPRGPVRSMAEGLPAMAKMSKAPVLFVGLSCNPAIRLNNWDRTLIPLPFGKGAVVWDRADFPEGAELADVIADWTARTTAVEAEADALTGLERV